MASRVVFPGSFDPLTIAHVAIAEVAQARFDADAVDLVLSTVALAKESGATSSMAERLDAIRSLRPARPWIDAVATDAQLLVDLAQGYDVLVIGADKWHQLHDVSFYGHSADRRDDALARLPRLAVAPRRGIAVPAAADVVHLDVPEAMAEVSSTAVRNGRQEWRA